MNTINGIRREDYATSDEYWAARDKAAHDIEVQMQVNRAKAERGELPSFVDVDVVPDWQKYV
jgi:hypothetical protein